MIFKPLAIELPERINDFFDEFQQPHLTNVNFNPQQI